MFTAYEGSLDCGAKMVYSYNDKNELIKKEEYINVDFGSRCILKDINLELNTGD